MCLRKQPFDAQSLPALALKISRGEYTPIPKVYSRQLKKLVGDMMQVEPNKRPNIDEILRSPLTSHRVDQFLPKEIRERQFSSHSMGEGSMNKGGLGPASKGLFIKCGWQDSGSEPMYSPKNYMQNKNYDMPVKRIDNYTKEINNKHAQKGEKKASKKGEQLRKRQSSEPTLTPKGHTKIENERKVIAKNNSVVNFEKKGGVQNAGLFKKKSKHSPEMLGGLSEINEIQELKKDIESLRGQISHRTKEIEPVEVDQFEEITKQNEGKLSEEED